MAGSGVVLCAVNENELSAAKICKMQFWSNCARFNEANTVNEVKTSLDGKVSKFINIVHPFLHLLIHHHLHKLKWQIRVSVSCTSHSGGQTLTLTLTDIDRQIRLQA